MNITTQRQALLDGLLITSRAVSTRAALHSLTGILLTVSDGRLQLRASDMELGLEAFVEAEVSGDGDLLVPGRLLVDVVRSLPEGEVKLNARETERDLEILAGPSSFHLRTLSSDDFPKPPQPEGAPIELPTAELREAIDRVSSAASSDDARPVLTGILIKLEGDELTMVATDSYRLAVKTTKLSAAPGGELEANVPARALRELARLSEGGDDETVKITLSANQAVFALASLSLSSRLIDGQFPNYRQLLPEAFEHEIKLDREALLEVVRRVSQLAQRNAALRLSFTEGELVVAAETPDLGDAREAIPVAFSGEPIEIGFNPDYVRSGLESLQGEELVLKLIAPLRPGLLVPADGDDFSYLVMPIRLNQ